MVGPTTGQTSKLLTSSREEVFDSRTGYNWASCSYDKWLWQNVWRHAELPLVLKALELQKTKRGSIKILDVGCGTGELLLNLSSRGYEASSLEGIDISEYMLDIAKTKLNTLNVRLKNQDFREYKARKKFDVISMCRVLTHFEDLSGAFEKASALLVDAGELVLSGVHSDHAYEYTSPPLPWGGKINIETFNYPLPIVIKCAKENRLSLSEIKILTFRDVRDLEKYSALPQSLDLTGKYPFGYFLSFTRRVK